MIETRVIEIPISLEAVAEVALDSFEWQITSRVLNENNCGRVVMFLERDSLFGRNSEMLVLEERCESALSKISAHQEDSGSWTDRKCALGLSLAVSLSLFVAFTGVNPLWSALGLIGIAFTAVGAFWSVRQMKGVRRKSAEQKWLDEQYEIVYDCVRKAYAKHDERSVVAV